MTNLTKTFIIINYLKHILRVSSWTITSTAEADHFLLSDGFFVFFVMKLDCVQLDTHTNTPGVKAEASWTLSMRRRIGADLVRSTKGETVTAVDAHTETSQEDWLKEHRAAWRWWVSGCAGTDGTLNGPTGCAGQAGATWLVETDEDWVLETLVVVSSLPNGFFPQHTVVIMQFLNWRWQEVGWQTWNF